MASAITHHSSYHARAAEFSATKSMSVATERLATGKRINAARDDAAGTAISSRINADIFSVNQSVRNALDAQALLDTAEGAMQELSSLMQRIRVLSLQAATDTNSAADREALNSEAQNLLSDYHRIIDTTTWAGKKILDGSFINESFQIGSSISALDKINVSISGLAPIELIPSPADSINEASEEIINFAADDPAGVTVSLEPGTYTLDPVGIAEGGLYDVWSGWPGDTTFFYEYTVSSEALGGSTRVNYPSTRYVNPRDAIDNATSYTFTLSEAADVNVKRFDNPGEYRDNRGGLSIKLIRSPLPTSPSQTTTIERLLMIVDAALEEINDQRAQLGSISNRLGCVVASNTSALINSQVSLGRIQDADFALESCRMAQSQILQRAPIAMLAQANVSKQEFLKLLES